MGTENRFNLYLSTKLNKSAFIFVFKALDRGAALLEVDKLATGHNADDIAETVLLNILRGDIARYRDLIFKTC